MYEYEDFMGDPTIEQDGVVQLSGTVSSVRVTNNSQRVTILALMPVSVTVLDLAANVSTGTNVTVTGQVEEFRGSKQILAHSIAEINPTVR